jgi:hypothetical protein
MSGEKTGDKMDMSLDAIIAGSKKGGPRGGGGARRGGAARGGGYAPPRRDRSRSEGEQQ